jgi:flagellar biosynthesis regulator FlaF
MKFAKKNIEAPVEDWLSEENVLEESTNAAIKSIIAWQLAESDETQENHQTENGRKDENQPHPTRPRRRPR